VSLIAGAQGASADEREGSGLLGAVGSVLGGVADTTDAVSDGVGGLVTTVIAPVNAAVEPVLAALAPAPAAVPGPAADPEPAAAVPAPADATPADHPPTDAPTADPPSPGPSLSVVGAVPGALVEATELVNGTLDRTDAAATGLLRAVADTASGLASGGLVEGVSTPALGAVDGVLGDVPIVSDLVSDALIGDRLSPVTGTLDDTLAAVVGSVGSLPESGVLPHIPPLVVLPVVDAPAPPGTPGGDPPRAEAPGTDGPTHATVTLHATLGAGAAASVIAPEPTGTSRPHAHRGSSAATPDDARTTPGDAGLPVAPAPIPVAPVNTPGAAGQTNAAGAPAGGAAASDAVLADDALAATVSLILAALDDELPSSPVFATDTTPD